MKLLSIALLFVAHTTQACSCGVEPRQTTPVHLYAVCDSRVLDEVQSAFRQWNAALDGMLTLDTADAQHPPNLFIEFNGLYFIRTPLGTLGVTERKVGEITVVYLKPYLLTDPTMLRLVLLHEFGHVLGLPHLAQSEAIMFQYVLITKPPVLTKYDVEFIRELYHLGPFNPSFSIKDLTRSRLQRKRLFSTPYKEFVYWRFGDGIAYLSQDSTKVVHWFPHGGVFTVKATYLGVEANLTLFDRKQKGSGP